MRHIKINIQRVHPHMQNIMTGHYFLWLWWSLTSAAAILSTHRQLSRHHSWQLLAHTCKKLIEWYIISGIVHGWQIVPWVSSCHKSSWFPFSIFQWYLLPVPIGVLSIRAICRVPWWVRVQINKQLLFLTQILYWHQQCARKGKRQISVWHQFAGDRKTLECCK